MKKIVITCPCNMSDKTYDYICDGLRDRLGGDVSFEKCVSSELIGGFTVAYDGKFYDMSINTQMDMLRKHMCNG